MPSASKQAGPSKERRCQPLYAAKNTTMGPAPIHTRALARPAALQHPQDCSAAFPIRELLLALQDEHARQGQFGFAVDNTIGAPLQLLCRSNGPLLLLLLLLLRQHSQPSMLAVTLDIA